MGDADTVAETTMHARPAGGESSWPWQYGAIFPRYRHCLIQQRSRFPKTYGHRICSKLAKPRKSSDTFIETVLFFLLIKNRYLLIRVGESPVWQCARSGIKIYMWPCIIFKYYNYAIVRGKETGNNSGMNCKMCTVQQSNIVSMVSGRFFSTTPAPSLEWTPADVRHHSYVLKNEIDQYKNRGFCKSPACCFRMVPYSNMLEGCGNPRSPLDSIIRDRDASS